jgi:hypothetical protein
MTNEEVLVLEQRVNELKKLYENYFAGIERLEPLKKREQMATEFRKLTNAGVQANTQVLFRFNNLRARFATLEVHWSRVVKQIEEGRLRRGHASASASASTVVAVSAAAPAPVETASAPPPAANDQAMRALYDKYAKSRAQSGEPPVSFESMVASLNKQVPAVIERYKCKSVDFRVAQKDGKTIIKAVPIT